MTAFVREVRPAAIVSEVRHAVFGSTSIARGIAPAAATADAVGTAVNAGTSTSSPGSMPAAVRASCRRRLPTTRQRSSALRATRQIRIRTQTAQPPTGNCRLPRFVPSLSRTSRQTAARVDSGRRQVPRVTTIEGRGLANADIQRCRGLPSEGLRNRGAISVERTDVDALMIVRRNQSKPDCPSHR